MANLGATFDATTVDPEKPFEVLPRGKYVVQIVDSEIRPTRDGRGQYLWLELDVLEGEYMGRKLFDRLNLVNSNQQTMEMAQRTLSAICHATGRMQVQDSQELHLIPMIADVTVKAPQNGYGESNKIRYQPLEQAGAAARPTAPERPAASSPAPRSSAPAQAPRTAAPTKAPLPAAPSSTFASAPWKRSA